MDPFCYFCFALVFIMLPCLFLKPCDHLLGKLSACWCYLAILSLFHIVFQVIVSIPDISLPLRFHGVGFMDVFDAI